MSAPEGHCDECTKGVLHTGTPSGSVTKFAGVDTYFARPSGKPKSAVVIATDVFGYSFVNAQLIADSIADHTGFLVVIPDLFNNSPLHPDVFNWPAEKRNEAFGPWLAKAGPPDAKLPIIRKTIEELKSQEGITKIGIIGYCYGGRISVLISGEGLVHASAAAHPAPIKLEEVEKINVHTLWLCAETDNTFGDEPREATKALLAKRGVQATFKLYPGTQHGFAARGDDTNEAIKKAQIDALDQTVQFFKAELQA